MIHCCHWPFPSRLPGHIQARRGDGDGDGDGRDGAGEGAIDSGVAAGDSAACGARESLMKRHKYHHKKVL